MSNQDFYITLMRSLSTGSVVFLVASGFSLIFGLLDVLNLAHGTLYMIGAYIGWTVFVRPDTFIDLLAPAFLLLAGLTLTGVFRQLTGKINLTVTSRRLISWGLIALGVVLAALILTRYPIAIWDLEDYTRSPVTFSFFADLGMRLPLEHMDFEEISPVLALIGLLLASVIYGLGIALLGGQKRGDGKLTWHSFILFILLAAGAVLVTVFNTQLTEWLVMIDSTWLFLIAIVVRSRAVLVLERGWRQLSFDRSTADPFIN